MENIYKFCLQSILVVITCSALSKFIPRNATHLMDRPWYHTQSKPLRQGLILRRFCCIGKEPDYHDSDGTVAGIVREGDTVVGSKGGLILLRSRINAEDPNHRPELTDPTPRSSCFCSKIYDPVCASNNESYFNLCFLECKIPKTENVTVVHQGNCIPF
ncbi:hypothetical protein HW555_001050 [Spodoptera exigua]|uniref:Kazal-like domain-containing protein n=1 Tax=Spodoptera exigua TaxID=7107 RepID=A0A835GTP8_SPOEX|nr:hypothetical protein HW555_001050 [Spodoptera exigua]